MKKFTNIFKAIAGITCLTVLINSASAQSWPPVGRYIRKSLANYLYRRIDNLGCLC